MPNEITNILLAEDNPADVFLVREALEAHHLAFQLHVVTDGETAIRFIETVDRGDDSPCPELALLDLNLPRKSGLEVLARIRRSARCGKIPVALISSSRSPDDVAAFARLGVMFFSKPSDYHRFMMLGGIIKDLLKGSLAS